MKVTDLTIKTLSEGKLMNYIDDSSSRLDLLDPFGTTGYQIEVKAKSAPEARLQVLKMLKSMGFKIATR
jgi:hypothetical protein